MPGNLFLTGHLGPCENLDIAKSEYSEFQTNLKEEYSRLYGSMPLGKYANKTWWLKQRIDEKNNSFDKNDSFEQVAEKASSSFFSNDNSNSPEDLNLSPLKIPNSDPVNLKMIDERPRKRAKTEADNMKDVFIQHALNAIEDKHIFISSGLNALKETFRKNINQTLNEFIDASNNRDKGAFIDSINKQVIAFEETTKYFKC